MTLFVLTYSATTEYKIDNMVSDLKKMVEHRMKTHLRQWRKRYLPFALGGDVLPAPYIANGLLGTPPTKRHASKELYLYVHKSQAMAAGVMLCDLTTQDMELFRHYMSNNWFKMTTNSQLTERWVEDSNECTATSKDENISNIHAIIRSRTVMYFNDDIRDDHVDRTRKAIKFNTRGKLGERIDKQTGVLDVVDDKKKEDKRGSTTNRKSTNYTSFILSQSEYIGDITLYLLLQIISLCPNSISEVSIILG